MVLPILGPHSVAASWCGNAMYSRVRPNLCRTASGPREFYSQEVLSEYG
jgi:hypothetical protein